jgi:hypothetical protein
MRSIGALLLAWLLAVGAPGASQSGAGFPTDADAFMKRVRDAARLDYEIQKQFTYRERRRDIRFSKLGKVTVGPLRTFEVYPSEIPGRTYKRLIAIDGKPLDASDLARRDAERQKSLREAEERFRAETPGERAARVNAEAAETRERDAVLDDVLAVFEATFTRRDVVNGQAVLIAKVTPRPKARVTTREGRRLKQFAGEVWIAEADYQIARLELRALADVSIGWGIVGRVDKGSRFLFVRRKIEDAWLPAEVTFEASGRTLLFRKFQIDTTTTYSDYRRIRR